jgi:hypothetical protein
MKTRAPIKRNKKQHSLSDEIKNTFWIQFSLLRMIELTSNNKIFGNPWLYISVSCKEITGFAYVIDEDIILPGTFRLLGSNSLQINSPNNLSNSSFEISIVINKLLSYLDSNSKVNSLNEQTYKITLSKLCQFTLRAIEQYNATIKSQNLLAGFYLRNSIPQKRIHESEELAMLYASVIHEKKIWWININSFEVTANQKGILYNEEYYEPIETSDLLTLTNLVKENSAIVLTLYPHPNNRTI